ncbi:MAG: prephenate dehydrogenase/arogenate dehydrogenase family protein, partial [Thaumarchaeota archaeon]|nr:prephenate dehydrogenase/arogenate dehydrogenase family protein [Nitrososphaerota archaeon]
IAVIPIRDAGSLIRVVNLFKRIGLNVVVPAPEEHDALMAFIQVAHHVTYLSLALALWESVDPKLLGKYSTRSLRQTALMFKSLHRNFKVIREIQESNIYGDLARRKLIECINRLGSDDREAWKNVEKALKKLPQAILP